MIGLWTRTQAAPATDRTQHEQRPTLEYAPTPPKHQTRVWFKRVTLTIFFLAAIAVTFAVARRLVWNWQVVRDQEARASYRAPADQVVWDRSGRAAQSRPVIFQHGRSRADGVERIVTVTVSWSTDDEIEYSCNATPMLGLWDWGAFRMVIHVRGARTGSVDKLFAGQPDPQDESHFTIEYQIKDQKGTIDGWLMNDDSVKLEVRDGPLRER